MFEMENPVANSGELAICVTAHFFGLRLVETDWRCAVPFRNLFKKKEQSSQDVPDPVERDGLSRVDEEGSFHEDTAIRFDRLLYRSLVSDIFS